MLPLLPKFPFQTTQEELKLLPQYKEELIKCFEKYLDIVNSAAKIAEQDQGVFDLSGFHKNTPTFMSGMNCAILLDKKKL